MVSTHDFGSDFLPMRIAQIVSGRGVNGAVTHCLNLASGLRERRNEVILICRGGSWIAQQARPARIEVVESELRRWPLQDLRGIAALLEDRGIDVVHTHMSRAHLFGVLLKLFTPIGVVATAHTTFFQPHWYFNDHVIAPSEAVRDFQMRLNRVPPRRVSVVPLFVDAERFAPLTWTRRAEVRASLGVSSDVSVLGFVGAVIPRKGLLDVIHALPSVLLQVKDLHLVIAGWEDPSYAARVRAAAHRLDLLERVHWLGERHDVAQIIGAVDALVLPSRWESFGLVLIEAMACGTPVVAARAAAVPEVVEDGVSGLLVPLGDHLALASALTLVLRDQVLRQCLIAGGRRAVGAKHYAPDRIAEIEEVLARCAANRPLLGPNRPR